MQFTSRYPKRYHVHVRGKRTTISIDPVINNLACAHFGTNPYLDESHAILKAKIQEEIDKDLEHYSQHTSQHITQWLAMTFCDRKTFTSWLDMARVKD